MMQRLVDIYKTVIALSLGVLPLCACSDDTEPTSLDKGTQLKLVVFPQTFRDMTPTWTRAGLPDGFVPYEELTPHVDASRVQIRAIITGCKEEDNVYNDVISNGIFAFHDETVDNVRSYSWTSTIPTLQPGHYFIYGFMPAEDLGSVAIDPYDGTSFQSGAVMTIAGLDVVTPSDVCVVVGVKAHTDNTTPIGEVGISLGEFEFVSDAENTTSYAYLLLDHIFSGLSFRFSVDSEYNQRRTIKLKKIALRAIGSSTISTVTATVKLKANSGSSPLEQVTFTADEPVSGGSKSAAIYDSEEVELTTTPQDFLACLVPNMNSTFELETVYNVYDKAGTLLREDQTVKNQITLPSDLMAAGSVYTMNVTVVPTYLYMLSEPDLDNPVIQIDN